jgi:hypothetical protein
MPAGKRMFEELEFDGSHGRIVVLDGRLNHDWVSGADSISTGFFLTADFREALTGVA